MDATKAKQPKRRRQKPMSFWVTPAMNALIEDRCAELGVDRSTLLRAGLWLCVLQPEFARKFLEKDDGATSLSPSGFPPNSTTPSTISPNERGSAVAMRSAPPSPPSYSAGGMTVTQPTYGIFSDVGGWDTPRPMGQRKNLPDRGLSARCGKVGVIQNPENCLKLSLPAPSIRPANRGKKPARQPSPTWFPSIADGPKTVLPATSYKLSAPPEISRLITRLQGQRVYAALHQSQSKEPSCHAKRS